VHRARGGPQREQPAHLCLIAVIYAQWLLGDDAKARDFLALQRAEAKPQFRRGPWRAQPCCAIGLWAPSNGWTSRPPN